MVHVAVICTIEAPDIILDQEATSIFLTEMECSHRWGGGYSHTFYYRGGILVLASSVDDTSVVYEALMEKDAPGLADSHRG